MSREEWFADVKLRLSVFNMEPEFRKEKKAIEVLYKKGLTPSFAVYCFYNQINPNTIVLTPSQTTG